MIDSEHLKYKKLNDICLLIEWPSAMDPSTLKSIINARSVIHESLGNEIQESVPAYHSLTLFFKTKFRKELMVERVQYALRELKEHEFRSSTWELPVCYDAYFGLDIGEVSKHAKLSIKKLIHFHSNSEYLVHFIGFLPGFLYLGGMDNRLAVPRRSTPRPSVAKGAVGIAGSQTGIYPQESPGGWNIIGNCPISLFTAQNDPPCFAKAGDRIVFKPIDRATHEKIMHEPPDWNSLKIPQNR